MDAFGRGILVNAQTAGHAEMDEQRIHTEPEQQILASSLDLFDRPADEFLRQVLRNRPAQSAVVESYRRHILPPRKALSRAGWFRLQGARAWTGRRVCCCVKYNLRL